MNVKSQYSEYTSGNYYAIRDDYHLQYIDASVNMINSMTVLSILPSVKEINLSNNTIHKIAPNTFLGKKNLAKVHLERNRLETLDVSSLMVSLGPNDGELKINQIDEKFFNLDTILSSFYREQPNFYSPFFLFSFRTTSIFHGRQSSRLQLSPSMVSSNGFSSITSSGITVNHFIELHESIVPRSYGFGPGTSHF